MQMNKNRIMGMMAVAALAAAPAFAGLVGQVELGGGASGNLNGSGGGSFPIEWVNGTIKPANFEFGTSGTDDRTFCVEGVVFSPGTTYFATVDGDSILQNGGSLNSDIKKWFAAYADGMFDTVAGLDPDGAGGDPAATARAVGTNRAANRALQAFFWDQLGVNGGDNVVWLQNNDSTAYSLYLGYEDFIANTYSSYRYQLVQVLNLWQNSDATGDVQSHLVMVVPAPAAALLGVLGLGITGWVKRRFA
jgi:hypothetical protein